MVKTKDTSAPSTTGMVDYDAHSEMQAQAVLSKTGRLGAIVKEIGLVDGEFVHVDYGSGPAHSAMSVTKAVVAAYRTLSPDAGIVVRHQDQPGNDWNSLLALAFGPDGYQGEAVRTEVAVGSFYDQMAAPGSVALATCFTASHWMKTLVPVNAPNTAWFADLEGEARRIYAARARADWTEFLRRRAHEMRSGGYLFVNTLGAVSDESQPNGVRAAASRLYRAQFTVADGMVRDGLLQRSALDAFTFPVWFPTAVEARAPIDEEADLASAFEVIEAVVRPAAYNPGDVYADLVGDPDAYAKAYCGYIRAYGETSLKLHLFRQCARDGMDVDTLNAEYFRRLENFYRSDHPNHASETLIVTLLARRK